MTGLDPATDSILEIFCVVTDGDLNFVSDDGEGFHAVIQHPSSRLDAMDSWCTTTHASSGLTAAVLASDTTASEAGEMLFNYVTRHVPSRGVGLLAGSSVGVDRAFLLAEPAYRDVVRHLHYRIFDVSSIKEAAKRWCPNQLLKAAPRKKWGHRARDDILESIAEARYYKEAVFGKRGAEVKKEAEEEEEEAVGWEDGEGRVAEQEDDEAVGVIINSKGELEGNL